MEYSLIIVLMSLSTNSIICINSESIYFSLIMVIFFCFFASLVIFNWLQDIENFTLLGILYFSICINILKLFLSPWDIIKLVGHSLSLSGFASMLC